MSRPTIGDVAKRAGVGIGTVSRVLNNSPQVKPETRERVLSAIRDLNFKPDSAARHLARKTRLQNIGILTQPFINYHSLSERLRGIQKTLSLEASAYELVLYSVSSLTNYAMRLSTIVQTQAVTGLLIIDLDLSDEQEESLQSAGIPFVGVGNLPGKNWPYIGTDNAEGGYLATRYLLESGHRRIGYIGDEHVDPFGFQTSEERYQGYRRALEERDILVRDEYVLLGPHGSDSAQTLTATALSLPEPPTAIFAMSDIQALGCIAAIREAGLRIPEDVSVIGYDDLEMSQHVGLTTVRQHLELSGAYALSQLLNLINDDDKAIPLLPSIEVIPRQTTANLA